MLPTFHCAARGCLSTCDLSSRDRDRVPDALKERGWATVTAIGKTNYFCPNHKPVTEDTDEHEVLDVAK